MSGGEAPRGATALADRALGAAALVAGAIIAFVAGAIVVNVVLRYGFGSGLLGVFEAAQWGMVAALFLALPATSRSGGHVAVDLFSGVGGAGFWRAVDVVVNLASAAVLGLLAWRFTHVAAESAEFGEVTNLLLLPQAPFLWLAAAGAAASALVFAAEAAQRVARRA